MIVSAANTEQRDNYIWRRGTVPSGKSTLARMDTRWINDATIRMEAKRAALDAIAKPVSEPVVAQNWAQSSNTGKTTAAN